ncbi:hypothetical protein ACIOZM_15100 [Pseudomonas sp. NPDC087346]|uniref:hypothetical protein n=1 Tax=Pseudomonas sp. NPDC087346 TaxID=3364438 RepID=UPI00380E0760
MDLYSFQIITLGTDAANGQATWPQYLTALLTPLVAALGIWIAFNQWKTARMKLKLDLFDKRVAVYETVVRVVRETVLEVHFTDEMLSDYVEGIAGTRWLYDEKMKDYLIELVDSLGRIRPFNGLPDNAPEGFASEIEMRELEALAMLEVHWDKLDEKFAPYLSLGH